MNSNESVQYQVVAALNHSDLARAVTKELSKGWKVAGNVVWDGKRLLMQSMIKHPVKYMEGQYDD